MINSIKSQIYLILRVLATVFDATSENFNVFFYIINASGNREDYSPLWHEYNKIYVDNLKGVLIGNSRARVFSEENVIALFQHA